MRTIGGGQATGLQSQTGAEPGELRKIDGGGGGENAANGLRPPGRAVFPFVGSRNSGKCSHHSPTGIFLLGGKTSNREKYFSLPPLTVNPTGSFHTASRLVRPQIHKDSTFVSNITDSPAMAITRAT